MIQIAPKTAFVFAGGGSLGAIQVGMLRVLLSAGVRPDFVIGTSVGALNAGYFAGAPNAEGVGRLEEIWSGMRRSDVFPFTFESAFGLLRHSGYIVNPSRLRRLIENNLPYAYLEDAMMPVHVVATDVQGMPVLLSKGSAIDAILASAAIPGVFPPVPIDGQMLMDGAIATNTPIRAAANAPNHWSPCGWGAGRASWRPSTRIPARQSAAKQRPSTRSSPDFRSPTSCTPRCWIKAASKPALPLK